MPPSLDQIGIELNSDKSSLVHGYLSSFEENIFSKIEKPSVILEFCWSNDISIKMWRAWAPNAKIIAVFPAPAQDYAPIPGVIYEFGKQDDPDLIARLISRYQPNVVLDDGSHLAAAQISTLSTLFPLLPKKAVYIIEDTHTNYGDLRSRYQGDSPQTTTEYLMQIQAFMLGDKVDNLSAADSEILNSLSYIAIHRKFAVLYRNDVAPPQLRVIRPITEIADKIIHERPAEVYQRGEIRLFEAEPYVANAVKQRAGNVTCPTAWVASLRNARIMLEGLVLDRSGNVVGESLINRDHAQTFGPFRRIGQQALASPPLPAAKRIQENGAPCALLTQLWDSNYGHWLVESLPRIALLEQCFDTKSLKYLIFNRRGPIRDVYIQSLSALGISEKNIIWHNGNIEVDNLIYTSPITKQPWVKSPLCVEVLERLQRVITNGAQDSSSEPSRIYLSRNKDSGDRLLINEDEVIDIVQAFGYKVVNAGLIDFNEQVRIFSNATHVCGNLGAAFTNIAFAPKGVNIFALTSERMVDDFFYDLCTFKRGRYWSLHGRAAGVRNGYRDDFTINTNTFKKLLREFHGMS